MNNKDEYSISLRIHIPAELWHDSVVGLKDYATSFSDIKKGPMNESYVQWEFDIRNTSYINGIDADDFNSLFITTIDSLPPIATYIEEYAKDFDIFWWCGYFKSSRSGGPFLSTELLRKLAFHPIPIYINVY